MLKRIFGLIVIVGLISCGAKSSEERSVEQVPVKMVEGADSVYFASGCFWCTEAVFERVQGVLDVVSGYSGGTIKNPTYKQVSYGMTNHAEAVRVVYDPSVISYSELVEIFYASHDPTQVDGQGPDIGKQYRSAIFFKNNKEKKVAQQWKDKLNESGKYNKPIATEITKYTKFWEAEDYHQDYYELNPNQPYVLSVSKPKVEKFMKEFKEKLKPKYK